MDANEKIDKETLAHRMYDVYCRRVGGKAFNGLPLPSSKEFFKDDTKTEQAEAWIAAADEAIFLLTN